MNEALTVWEVIERGGVPGILLLVCLGLYYLYRQEREENRKLNAIIAESGKESVKALVSVEAAMAALKEALQSLRHAIGNKEG